MFEFYVKLVNVCDYYIIICLNNNFLFDLRFSQLLMKGLRDFKRKLVKTQQMLSMRKTFNKI